MTNKEKKQEQKKTSSLDHKETEKKNQKGQPTEQDEKFLSVKESDYTKLKEDAAEYKDKFVRLMAEFENMRKRMEREKLEFIKFANEELIAEFLNILDDLERSVDVARTKHQDYEAFLKGVEMVMTRVLDMLRKNNVVPIEAKGKKFDPHFHEPLMQEETDQAEEGTVLEEFQKGYLFNGRVVRTSKVKLATPKKEESKNNHP